MTPLSPFRSAYFQPPSRLHTLFTPTSADHLRALQLKTDITESSRRPSVSADILHHLAIIEQVASDHLHSVNEALQQLSRALVDLDEGLYNPELAYIHVTGTLNMCETSTTLTRVQARELRGQIRDRLRQLKPWLSDTTNTITETLHIAASADTPRTGVTRSILDAPTIPATEEMTSGETPMRPAMPATPATVTTTTANYKTPFMDDTAVNDAIVYRFRNFLLHSLYFILVLGLLAYVVNAETTNLWQRHRIELLHTLCLENGAAAMASEQLNPITACA